MKTKITPLILAAALALSIGTTYATEAENATDNAEVKTDMLELFSAMLEGNADVIIEKTHPVLIKGAGGKEVFYEAMTAYFASPQFKETKMEDIGIVEPFTFLTTKDNSYVIVPTNVTITQGGRTIKVKSYQLGIYDNATQSWKYLDGSRMKREGIKQFFPDFPDAAVLPKVTHEVVTPKEQ